MSEYQYYEFLAVDRPLDREAQAALRDISSRARITTTSFANHYDFGDFKGSPIKLIHAYFDLHVYVANWGSRVLILRVPRRMIDLKVLDRFMLDDEFLTIQKGDEHVIFTISLNELKLDDFDDGTKWMGALAPLRAAVMSGDLRMFYLLWLMQVGFDDFMRDDAIEPLAGISPLDDALTTFAEFLSIDPDLLQAAAEIGPAASSEASAGQVAAAIAAMPEREKVDLLVQLHAGDDPHLGIALRRRVRETLGGSNDLAPPVRTAGELRAAVGRVALAREQCAAAELAKVDAYKAKQAETARKSRCDVLAKRGTRAWQDVEALIEQRKAAGYKEAAQMLADLRHLTGNAADFLSRIADIRTRHATKQAFIRRLDEGLAG